MHSIIILIDDRGFFYSSTKERGGSLDVDVLKSELELFGYRVEIKNFYQISFCESYKNKIILYQSTEDPDLKYKDYIEDILLGLQNRAAILVPDFHKFRAHHNKVYMEILRDCYDLDPYQDIFSKKYGTIEEFAKDIKNQTFPLVLKPGFGSRSKGICKVHTEQEAIKRAKRISRTFTLTNIKRSLLSLFDGLGYKRISNYRNKFIVQNYITGLAGDYKVLIYGDRYYVLKRENRNNDFRASGSGKFLFPDNPPKELLDFSKELFEKCNVPFASFDIAVKDNNIYLIEFQFVSFGQYALEKSSFYFKPIDNKWKKVEEKSYLEKIFAMSVDSYVRLYIYKK